jgi:hypothetical protein
MRGLPMRGLPMRGLPMRGLPMRGLPMHGRPMHGRPGQRVARSRYQPVRDRSAHDQESAQPSGIPAA